METSDDDGESATATFAKALFVLFLILPACNKSQKTSFFKPVVKDSVAQQKVSPPVVKAKPKKSKKKKLYLTFDDGPNKGTKNVLHIVKDEGVPVTFFVVGQHVFASKGQHELWDSLKITEHVQICNHGYTHGWNNRYATFYQNPDSVVKDFERTKDSLDLTNNIIRTPGRNIWRIDSLKFTDLKKSTAAADSLQKAGFIVMGWDLEWHYDHKNMSVTDGAERIVDQIDSIFAHNKTQSPEHLVLLAHDQVYVKSGDSLQLRKLLKLLKQKEEYELSVATDYPGAEE
jgi:peptidoglycan-N-acetylglucosamine deacetylase